MRRNKFKTRKFEKLEDRRMMTGDVSFNEANGVLTITGAGFDDVAVVRFDGDEVHVDLDAAESNGDTESHGETKDIADVTKIVFNGLAGKDRLTVEVDDLNSGVSLAGIELEFNGGDNDDTLDNTDVEGGVRTKAFGGAGNDTLEGSGRNDTFEGGAGDDTLTGLGGDDTYFFVGNTLGYDRVTEAANVDVDTLDFAGFGGLISVNLASTSDQTVRTNHLRLRLSSATGMENVIGSIYSDKIYGNSRNNDLSGLSSVDYLYGRDGADTLRGGDGDDYLYGENGDDDLFGGANKDRLYGGANNDDLFGEGGDDSLYGEAGLDNLNGGADKDFLDGGYDSLNDILFGGSGVDTFVLHKRRGTGVFPTEQTLSDYASAVDLLMTAWH